MLPPEDVDKCLEVMKRLLDESNLLAELSEEQRVSLMTFSGQLSRPSRDQIRKRNRDIHLSKRRKAETADRQLKATSGIRQARLNSVFVAPALLSEPLKTRGRLNKPRRCYVCKDDYLELHHFYDSMCMKCGDFNYGKRGQSARLDGQVAVITGSRLKIGYQATLMMLRAGARVIATTRFPHDAATRFSGEIDFAEWKDRLQIYGLDLRHTPSVEIFCTYLASKEERLDILINNAAQTVRRPTGFYRHLLSSEANVKMLTPEACALLKDFSECKVELESVAGEVPQGPSDSPTLLPVTWHGQGPGVGLKSSAALSQIPYSFDASLTAHEVFPEGQLDQDLQQVDLRRNNSWRLALADVPTAEMLEVQLVNSVAPFVLCSRLAPLMRRDVTGCKHIVNVSAMEGKFTRFTKTDKHPHTNMAKAALNMMTLTSAPDLAKDGIFMNAVDTGWVTDEDPAAISKRKQEEHDFQPPLDIVDGAARICDPFFHGILSGSHWSGKFLKDYFPTEW